MKVIGDCLFTLKSFMYKICFWKFLVEGGKKSNNLAEKKMIRSCFAKRIEGRVGALSHPTFSEVTFKNYYKNEWLDMITAKFGYIIS